MVKVKRRSRTMAAGRNEQLSAILELCHPKPGFDILLYLHIWQFPVCGGVRLSCTGITYLHLPTTYVFFGCAVKSDTPATNMLHFWVFVPREFRTLYYQTTVTDNASNHSAVKSSGIEMSRIITSKLNVFWSDHQPVSTQTLLLW